MCRQTARQKLITPMWSVSLKLATQKGSKDSVVLNLENTLNPFIRMRNRSCWKASCNKRILTCSQIWLEWFILGQWSQGPAAAATSISLSGMQILWPQPRPIHPETLAVGPATCLKEPPVVLMPVQVKEPLLWRIHGNLHGHLLALPLNWWPYVSHLTLLSFHPIS